ncbi:hypothetical protein Tco_0091677 [Tanacetum coccineum]
MGKQTFNTDAKGWTWIFRNNKNPNLKNIDNPYNKDLERIATSFYVSNLPDSLDAKLLCQTADLWMPSYLTNAPKEIGNFYLYVTVSIFQCGNSSTSQPVNRPPAKDANHKTEQNPKTKSNPNFPYRHLHTNKPTFADVTLNKQKPTTPTHTPDTVRTINLSDNDLIAIEDSTTVILLKLNEAETLSNMYSIYKSEGFMDLSIHHVRGLWIWIQFSLPLSCSKFCENANIKSIYSSIRTPSPSFKVDERMIWIKISGLPLCAWGSNSYKKIALLFGKLKFFEDEESTAMSLGRVCISTRSYKQISDTIKVEVKGEMFDVNVIEIGT